VTIDLADFMCSGWTYDSVPVLRRRTGTQITLLFNSQGSDESWARLARSANGYLNALAGARRSPVILWALPSLVLRPSSARALLIC